MRPDRARACRCRCSTQGAIISTARGGISRSPSRSGPIASRTMVNAGGYSRSVSFTTARVRTRRGSAVHCRLRLDRPRRALPRRPALARAGSLRQQGQRPEQCHRGRLVAGQQHGRELVAQLLGGEACAGLRIARGAQQIEQIARRGGLRLAQTVVHDRFDQPHPALLEAPAASSRAGRHRRRQQHVEQMRLREAVREFGQQPPQRRAVLPASPARTCCGRRFPVSGSASPQQVDRLAGRLCRRASAARRCGRDDVPCQHRHDARRQRGRDGAALQAPGVALAQQQPVSPVIGRRMRIDAGERR